MAGPGEADGRPERGREWYRRLVEQASAIIAILDPDGSITYASPAVERTLGYDPAELIGVDGYVYVHPDDETAIAEAIETLTVTPKDPQTVEFRFQRADGSWCWLEVTIRNQLGDDVIDGILLHGREITERKERESERVADRERMKMALEGANLGIWDWDMVTDEVSRDELLTNMLGYTQSEMGDHLRGWEKRVHPEDKQRHDEALAEHVKQRTPYYECEYRLETKAGKWKWVRTIGKVVERDEEGQPVRAVGIHQDVDDRKRAELALEEREQKYRHLFENTRDALMLFDREGYHDCNERALELFGLESVQAFLGLAPWELSPPTQPDGSDSKDVALARIERAFEEGEAFFEFVHQRADGTEFPAEVKLSRFEYEGEPVLQALVRDITARKEQERELQAREAKYRSLFEDTRDALMLLDRDGFMDCNERTLELFGVESVEAFAEHAPWDLSPLAQPDGDDSKEVALEYVEQAFEEGEAFFEWTHQRVDGTTFPAEVKLSRFDHEDGQALHALVRDITERKEYERQLQEQRDNLEVLNQVVRHDIRNDIQLITSYAELLGEDDKVGQEYVDKILENADHAVELTASAREMANVMLSAEKELKPVGLRETIEAQLSDVRSAYSGAVVTTVGTIPPIDVRANDMLDSVFRNLLKNAVQHNDAEIPKVTVSATRQGEWVVIRVADNGPGIPDERKEAVFGKSEAGLESHGTGIGLYLVETLVENYGGDVRIEDRRDSARGRQRADDELDGAVFVVELPRAET